MKNFKVSFAILCVLLAVKALLLAWAMPYTGIGLAPDEAQYWTWSQHLDWGYYSKPPAIAWQIWLGTSLLGNSEMGVRLGAFIIGFFLPCAVFFLAKSCLLKPSTAFWSGIVMAFSPLGIMASFLATTDGGFVLFWTLACAVLASGISRPGSPQFILIGFFIFCGALFKWPIYLFWGFVILSLFVFKRHERLSLRSLACGILISLFGLLPSVIWNSSHEWATFRHVMATIQGGPKVQSAALPLFHGNFFDFIGAQVALFSPVLFILFVAASILMLRRVKEAPSGVLLCGMISLITFLSYAALALFQKMQGNWCLFAYPPAFIVVCWAVNEKMWKGKVWLALGVFVSIGLSVLVLSIPFIQSHSLWAKHPLPYRVNPFHHNVGWETLSEVLKKEGYDPTQHFIFEDKYQMASLLSFYPQGQKRAYFFNLGNSRKNQFSYWPQMSQQEKGKTGFFVWVENSPKLDRGVDQQIAYYQEVLKPYFREVRFVAFKPLFFSYGKMVKGALIFRCEEYNGLEPVVSSNLY